MAVALICFTACQNQMVPLDYTATVETGDSIESRYLKSGPYEVDSLQYIMNDTILKAITVYFPHELKSSNAKKYPAVVFANGSGVEASKYIALFHHLASWGFVAIGNEDPSSGNGVSSELTLSYLLDANNDTTSIFFGHVDVENIGITGHSQGGAAVFNAITQQEHGHIYKTAVALSPTHEELANNLNWHYSTSDVRTPVFMLAGTEGDFELKIVIPFSEMQKMYNRINAPKVMARRKGTEHGQMLYSADGYVTAWLMWQLNNDSCAAKAFTGRHPTLKDNKLYQNVQIHYEQAKVSNNPNKPGYPTSFK